MKTLYFRPYSAYVRICKYQFIVSSKHIFLLVMFMFPLLVSATTYTTIADGNWTNSSTWMGGSVPPLDISGHSVFINHDVTFDHNGVTLKIGETGTGLVQINSGGSFYSPGNNGNYVTVFTGGTLNCFDGHFELGIYKTDGSNANGNLEISGTVDFRNSTIKIAQNWQGKEGANRTVINCCMQLGENYQADKCTDYNENFCLELGLHGSGNFSVESGGSSVECNGCDILWPDNVPEDGNSSINPSGNFSNSGTFTGQIGTLYVRSGNAENSGTYDAPISVLCVVNGSITIPSEYRPAMEDCAAAADASCDPCEGTTLPIQLIGFEGQTLYNLENHLYWSTAAEINSDYFEVQKETNEMSWTTIGMLPAMGNSNEKTNYSFIDLSPVSGYNYYRVKMVDIDGNFEYSHIIVLQNTIKQEREFSIYPTPANESVNLIYRSEIAGAVDIQIVNHLGQIVHAVKDHALSRGINRMTIDIQSLTPGWYALQMKGEGVSEVKAFVKN